MGKWIVSLNFLIGKIAAACASMLVDRPWVFSSFLTKFYFALTIIAILVWYYV